MAKKRIAVITIVSDKVNYTTGIDSLLTQDCDAVDLYFIICKENGISVADIEEYWQSVNADGIEKANTIVSKKRIASGDTSDYMEKFDKLCYKEEFVKLHRKLKEQKLPSFFVCDSQGEIAQTIDEIIASLSGELIMIFNTKDIFLGSDSLRKLADYTRAVTSDTAFVIAQSWSMDNTVQFFKRSAFIPPLIDYMVNMQVQRTEQYILESAEPLLLCACFKHSFFDYYKFKDRTSEFFGMDMILFAIDNNIKYGFFNQPIIMFRGDGFIHTYPVYNRIAEANYLHNTKYIYDTRKDKISKLPYAKRRKIKFRYSRLFEWGKFSKLQKVLFVLQYFDIILIPRLTKIKRVDYLSVYELFAFATALIAVGLFGYDFGRLWFYIRCIVTIIGIGIFIHTAVKTVRITFRIETIKW